MIWKIIVVKIKKKAIHIKIKYILKSYRQITINKYLKLLIKLILIKKVILFNSSKLKCFINKNIN